MENSTPIIDISVIESEVDISIDTPQMCKVHGINQTYNVESFETIFANETAINLETDNFHRKSRSAVRNTVGASSSRDNILGRIEVMRTQLQGLNYTLLLTERQSINKFKESKKEVKFFDDEIKYTRETDKKPGCCNQCYIF